MRISTCLTGIILWTNSQATTLGKVLFKLLVIVHKKLYISLYKTNSFLVLVRFVKDIEHASIFLPSLTFANVPRGQEEIYCIKSKILKQKTFPELLNAKFGRVF